MSDFNLVFNNTELPAPTAYKVDYEPIVKANRNAKGDMSIEYIAEKCKVNLTWQQLDGEYYSKILSSRNGNKITGKLTFFDPVARRSLTINAYASPVSASLKIFTDDVQIWENVTLNFIQM